MGNIYANGNIFDSEKVLSLNGSIEIVIYKIIELLDFILSSFEYFSMPFLSMTQLLDFSTLQLAVGWCRKSNFFSILKKF